ncbi:MAG: beta-propeller fold lactonase family protein [Bacteriovoracia bacterium]
MNAFRFYVAFSLALVTGCGARFHQVVESKFYVLTAGINFITIYANPYHGDGLRLATHYTKEDLGLTYLYPYVALFDPLHQFIYIPNRTGNQLLSYQLNSDLGTLLPVSSLTVSNPRGLVADSSFTHLYASYGGPGGIQPVSLDRATGAMETQGFGVLATSSQEMLISPNERFVFTHAAQTGQMYVFLRNATTGNLSSGSNAYDFGTGAARNFAFSDDGTQLVVADSILNKVYLMDIHPDLGTLSLRQTISLTEPKDVIRCGPNRDFYVSGPQNLWRYTLADGVLTQAQALVMPGTLSRLGCRPDSAALFAVMTGGVANEIVTFGFVENGDAYPMSYVTIPTTTYTPEVLTVMRGR